MIPRKTTVVIFLCFSTIVAFSNMLIGEYQYVMFPIPFAFACILTDKPSKIAEIIGLQFISGYMLLFDNINMGLMLFIVTSAFVFTSPLKPKTARIYTYFTTVAIAIVSYIRFDAGADRIVHAMLDAMFFIVGAGSLYCIIYRAIYDAKAKDKPLEQKYLDTLDELKSVAHESIDMLKRMQGGEK